MSRHGRRVCIVPRLSLSELIVLQPLVHHMASVCEEVVLVAPRKYVHELRRLDMGESVRFKFVDSWHSSWADGLMGFDILPLQSFREACPYATTGTHIREARLVRDMGSEQALLQRVRSQVGEVYAVVHDDDERRIRPQLLPRNLPLVHVRDPEFRTTSIFHWIQVLDNAVEFHAIDSCFAVMADAFGVRPRTYVHMYCDRTPAHASFPSAVLVF